MAQTVHYSNVLFHHIQCSVPEADNKILLFFLFASIFFNFPFKACFLQNPLDFFSEDSIYYLPTLPSNFGKFDHDNSVLRIEKSLFSPLGSNVSRF